MKQKIRVSRSKQVSFDDPRLKKMSAFGGSLLRDKKNRYARPLSTKHPIHLVIKSSQAKGLWSFLQPRNRKILGTALQQMSERYGVRVLEVGNSGNHCHFLLKITNRPLYKSFIRAFTGTMVRRICGKAKLARRFFDFRPFSRVVYGSRGYNIARDYVLLNQLEGLGLIPYQFRRLRTNWYRGRGLWSSQIQQRACSDQRTEPAHCLSFILW